MQLYVDWCKKTPDELRDERNKHLQSRNLLKKRTAEKMLERFYREYPRKSTGLFVWRCVKSFYQYQGLSLVGIKTPNQDDLRVRKRDLIPKSQDILRMCEIADLRDRCMILVSAETDMRPGSLVRLQYKHLRQDFESGVIPCRVIIPLYENEFESRGVMTFLCQDAVDALKLYFKTRIDRGETISDETYIFPRYVGTGGKRVAIKGGRVHIGEDGFEAMIRRIGTEAGLIPRDAKGVREFRNYCFRKRAQTVLEGSSIPLNWVDLMLAHIPRGSSAKAYSRPSEEEMRESYSRAMEKLMVYGVPPSIATVEDAKKQAKLQFYELGIDNSPVKDIAAKEILEQEQKRIGRPLTEDGTKIDEKIKLLGTEVNLDKDVLGHAESHELAHGPVVGVQVDQSPMNPHLPLVPGLRSLAVGRFHRRDLQFFRRQGLRPFYFDSGFIGNVLDFLAHILQFSEVSARELHSCKLSQAFQYSSEIMLDGGYLVF
jgi:integrase